MATFTYSCPSCEASTDVTTKDSGVVWGSGPPLTVRFECNGCGTVLNATTAKEPVVWPDRPPRMD